MIESFDELSNTTTYLEHIWVNIPKRSVKILDTEGYEETVTCLLYTSDAADDP